MFEIPKSNNKNNQAGFTLMEIIVATTIFAIVTVALLSLFNYVLKINRRSQALTQASQGMRNFVEFLTKQIQNGQIDYYITSGTNYSHYINDDNTVPCGPPLQNGYSVGSVIATPTPSTYLSPDNKLGIINTDNVQECFYYADSSNNYIGASKFDSSLGGVNLVMQETGVALKQVLNPANFRIDYLKFFIQPICDPYTPSCSDYGTSFPKVQPSVTLMIKFTTSLPTGETVPIYYQTTISSNKYDIPNH